MKDRTGTIAMILAFVVLFIANILEGGTPLALFKLPPILLVVGVTILVAVAGGTMDDAKQIVPSIRKAFGAKIQPASDLVPTVVTLAERARREGLLALEDGLKDVDDPFLTKGVTMAIDGTDPDELRDILESEVHAKRAEDKQRAKFFNDAGAYSPTIGIVGTVMGLVHVLEQLAEPEKLGHLIAGAFLATLWGVMMGNMIWFPIGHRIKRLGQLEIERMELAIEGIAAIQAGSNPRLVAEKLNSLLPAAQQYRPEAA